MRVVETNVDDEAAEIVSGQVDSESSPFASHSQIGSLHLLINALLHNARF